MIKFLSVFSLLAVAALLTSCAATAQGQLGTTPDQLPMYGGTDRNANPLFREADEKLIAGTTAEFGSRRKASQAFVEVGLKFYLRDDLSTAMKRFNQAWLIDPGNPETFWGFGIVYHDMGENCKSKDMMEMAVDAGLAHPSSLTDAARVYTLCAVGDESLSGAQKLAQFEVSDRLFRRAEASSTGREYVYGSWATAYFWRGEYSNAWKMVHAQRALGGMLGEQFMAMLRSEMPEPQ